jgi:hypothetical protein
MKPPTATFVSLGVACVSELITKIANPAKTSAKPTSWRFTAIAWLFTNN